MSNIRNDDKQILESLFQMKSGYVLDFSDRTIGDFFKDKLAVDFFDEKYNYSSGSKANRMRGFWKTASNQLVAASINKLVEYIEHKIILGEFKESEFPKMRIDAAKNVARSLSSKPVSLHQVLTKANIVNQKISITLNKDIFSHVQSLLNSGHYYNAVEEAYKIVRKILKSVTGKEKASEAFSRANYIIIFGHEATDDAESNFFEGVKFLHMAIQNLRNEKAHTPAQEMDKNLAIHYIVLASLAYDLIDRDELE